ncbi:MAG: S-layer homology domain-containing protein [Clostridia bacterium]|nr:S-layer homology domain-containing protein [Clostridia bacterium]
MKKLFALILCITSLLAIAVFPARADGTNYYYLYDYDYYDLPDIYCPMFDDLSTDNWYALQGSFAQSNGLFNFAELKGEHLIENQKLDPNKPITREEAIFMIIGLITGAATLDQSVNQELFEDDYTIWGKRLEKDVKPSGQVFKDVSEDSPFFLYIDFAYKIGFTAGIGDGYFGFGKPISRQDFSVMLLKVMEYYLDVARGSFSYDDQVIKSFTDYASISGYALDALTKFSGISVTHHASFPPSEGYSADRKAWKILSGWNGLIMPRRTVTRAEAATMLFAMYTNTLD